jgi:hypothetical protein
MNCFGTKTQKLSRLFPVISIYAKSRLRITKAIANSPDENKNMLAGSGVTTMNSCGGGGQ